MGQCGAKVAGGKIDDEYEALGLIESDLTVLRNLFHSMDRKHEGLIEINVFLSVVDVEDCPVTRACFSFYNTFRAKGGGLACVPGKLHFKVFVLLVWNFCTMRVKSFCFLLFEMYDKDRKCSLVTEDIVQMLTDLKVSKDKINA